MSANTQIEWADHTFNPWIGCTKVSPACDNCYAEADFDKRRHVVQWGAGQPRKHTSPSTWAQPVKWNKEAERLGIRYRVFCASLADVFDNEVPAQWRQELMSLIARTPHLDWLLLTKRIGNARRMLSDSSMHDALLLAPNDAYQPPVNLWLGATICNQAEADRDIQKLLATPAAKRFISMEPLLGPVDLSPYLDGHDSFGGGDGVVDAIALQSALNSRIDWVIVGGESGPNARPMHPYWARDIRNQCQAAGVPFFFKQWGEWVDADNGPSEDKHYEGKADCWVHEDGATHTGENGVDFFHTYPMYRVGKKSAGRLLDGRFWDEVPASTEGGAA